MATTYTVLAPVQAPGFSHEGLVPDTEYTYRVIAVNAKGDAAPSNLASARTLSAQTAPATPTGLSVTAVGQTRLDVTWNPSNAATSYTLSHSLTATGTYTVISAAQGSTSYSHTGLSAGSTHYYKVQASNAQGSSLFSATVSGRTDTSAGTCATGSIIVQPGDNLAGLINGAAAGKTICINDGIYNVGNAILSPASNVTLIARNEPTLINTSKSGVYSVRPKVHITGTGLGGTGEGIFILTGSNNVTFHGLEISGAQGNNPPNTGRGIKASTGGTTVEYCWLHNNANQGIGQGDLLVHHCELDHNGSLPYSSGGTSGSAIKTTLKLVAHHNYLWENWGTALWLDCNGQKLICYDNLMENMQRYGIHYEISYVRSLADSKSYNNVVRGIGKHKGGGAWTGVAGHQGSGIGLISSRNHEVYGNFVENCSNAGYIAATRPVPTTNPAFGVCGVGWTLQDLRFHDNATGPGNKVNYSGIPGPGVIASNNT